LVLSKIFTKHLVFIPLIPKGLNTVSATHYALQQFINRIK